MPGKRNENPKIVMGRSKFNEYKGLDLPRITQEVLKLWDAEDTFRKSISTREGHPTFVFYEGRCIWII